MKKYWNLFILSLISFNAFSENTLNRSCFILGDKSSPPSTFECFGLFQSPPIKLIKATRQKRSAGIKIGGSSLEYSFHFIVTRAGNTVFDSVWINKKGLKTFVSKKKISTAGSPIKFNKGDTVIVRISESLNDNQSSDSARPPKKYSGAALLSYYFNSKKMYFEIQDISTISSINQP